MLVKIDNFYINVNHIIAIYYDGEYCINKFKSIIKTRDDGLSDNSTSKFGSKLTPDEVYQSIEKQIHEKGFNKKFDKWIEE